MGKKGKKGTKGKEGKKEQMAVVEGHLGLFQIKALEFCARKVGARSGDVRKCLDICRSFLPHSLLCRRPPILHHPRVRFLLVQVRTLPSP
jgi:hypothetical protein